MSDGITQCYFCQNVIPAFQWRANDTAEVQCKVCGPYRILEPAAWKGQEYVLLPPDHPEYSAQPWEAEADELIPTLLEYVEARTNLDA
jgi:hypothetical protein